MGMGHDAVVREAAELVADHGQRLVEAGLLHRGAPERVRQVFRGGGERIGRLALGQEALDGRVEEALHPVFGNAKVCRTDDLALVHRDAADQLRAVFCKQDLREKLLDFTKLAFALNPLCPVGGFA